MTENDINVWQDSISSIADKQFFNIMRLYLGEIQTPYNKQKLISNLASFIKNQDNINVILSYLDKEDLTILTAIKYIPQATKETLSDFFKDSFSVSKIYSKIVNLCERLLIYKVLDTYSQKEILLINPILQSSLDNLLHIEYLLPNDTLSIKSINDTFYISSNFLIAFISYINVHKIACKSDGIIKKNDLNRLQEIFPGKLELVQLLMNAFINLGLVIEKERGYEIENTKLLSFSQLSELQQYAFLCAASVSRFSREGLKKEAQLLIDCFSSIAENGYTRQTLIHLAFLVGTHCEDGSAVTRKTRFSQILERSKQMEEPQLMANLLDRMIDSAIEFGLLQEIGKNQAGEELYSYHKEMFEHQVNPNPEGTLNIDSTNTVSLMPGLSLEQLIPLSNFMLIKKYGVVTEFELTKMSISNAFDSGMIPASIYSEIQKYCSYEIPQSLKINIEEWFNSYNSAVLYHGYVLKVSDENINFVKNNPNINKYIKEELSPNIYLLQIPFNADIAPFVEESGLNFLGKIKEYSIAQENFTFPLLRDSKKLFVSKTETELPKIKDNSEKIINEFLEKLEKIDLDEHQKESLKYRIKNKLILNDNQLTKVSVYSEILEAGGMDFAGKCHLIDAAIKEGDLLEFEFADLQKKDSYFTIVGKPMYITKEIGEAIVRFVIEPSKEIENFLVSRITHVKRLRF